MSRPSDWPNYIKGSLAFGDGHTVLPVLRKRRLGLHVVIAGRYAPFELTDVADIVTEMRQIKHLHPARKISPQAGIEF